MKQTLIFLLLFTVAFTGLHSPKAGQSETKIPRRGIFRPTAAAGGFRGLVRDAAGNPVAGAGVEVEGLRKLVHSMNQDSSCCRPAHRNSAAEGFKPGLSDENH